MSYLNDLVVFPMFFNLSLNFAIRSSCSMYCIDPILWPPNANSQLIGIDPDPGK